LPSSEIIGTATGIDSDGQLLVTTPDGITHTISAADVVHIRAARLGLNQRVKEDPRRSQGK
jgi:hypothetical protein